MKNQILNQLSDLRNEVESAINESQSILSQLKANEYCGDVLLDLEKKDAILLRDVCRWVSTSGLLKNKDDSSMLGIIADVLNEDIDKLNQKELFN